MINACGMERGQKQDWSVGEAYMVSLPLEICHNPHRIVSPNGTSDTTGVYHVVQEAGLFTSQPGHTVVFFLYARLFSKLMALSRGSLLYADMFSSRAHL